MAGVGHEKDEEKWLEWSAHELIEAREVAFAYLDQIPSHLIPNSYLCQELGLPSDAYRPQRIIQWARNYAKH